MVWKYLGFTFSMAGIFILLIALDFLSNKMFAYCLITALLAGIFSTTGWIIDELEERWHT